MGKNDKCSKCGKIPAKITYKNKNYCTWYCAKKGQYMLNLLVWCGLIGFVYFLVVTQEDDTWKNSKALEDLNETIRNRNENI